MLWCKFMLAKLYRNMKSSGLKSDVILNYIMPNVCCNLLSKFKLIFELDNSRNIFQ